MWRVFSTMARSRLASRSILVLVIAAVAFWATFAIVVSVSAALVGPDEVESDPEAVLGVAVLLSIASVFAAMVAVIVVVRGRRQREIRQWLPLRDAMLRDASNLPSTYLARVVTTPAADSGGQFIAQNLANGHTGPLWLPGHDLPVGAVVCFTTAPATPMVRAWMTDRLWRACEREVARIEHRTTRAFARGNREQRVEYERQVRLAAADTVAEAERLLRDQRS